MKREVLKQQFLAMISEYSQQGWGQNWFEGIDERVRQIGGSFLIMAYFCGGWPCDDGGRIWLPLIEEERWEVEGLLSFVQRLTE